MRHVGCRRCVRAHVELFLSVRPVRVVILIEQELCVFRRRRATSPWTAPDGTEWTRQPDGWWKAPGHEPWKPRDEQSRKDRRARKLAKQAAKKLEAAAAADEG